MRHVPRGELLSEQRVIMQALSRGKLLGRGGGDQRVSVRGVPYRELLGRGGGNVHHVSRGELFGGGRVRGVRGGDVQHLPGSGSVRPVSCGELLGGTGRDQQGDVRPVSRGDQLICGEWSAGEVHGARGDPVRAGRQGQP